MKKAFTLLKLHDIDVASVEQFQGQERKVIIISTVRSRPQFLQFDYMFQLGFLQNPKVSFPPLFFFVLFFNLHNCYCMPRY